MKKSDICIMAAILLLTGCGSKMTGSDLSTKEAQPTQSEQQETVVRPTGQPDTGPAEQKQSEEKAERDFADKFHSIRLETMKLTTEKELPEALTEGGRCLKLADIAEESIRVYGYVDDRFGCRGVFIDRKGILSYFPDIYYSSPSLILPVVYWDKEKQMLVMSCNNMTGTGLSADQLFVFLCSDSRKIDSAAFEEADLGRQLEKQITFQYDKKEKKVVVHNRKGDLLGSERVSDEIGDREITGLNLRDMVTFIPGKVTRIQIQVGYVVEGQASAYYTDAPMTLSAPVTVKTVADGEQSTAEFQVGSLAQKNSLPDKNASSTQTTERTVLQTAQQTEGGSVHFWDGREQKDAGENELSFATGMQITLPEEWNGKVITKVVAGSDQNGSTLIFMDKEAEEGGVGGALCYLEYVNRNTRSAQEPYEIFPGDQILGTYRTGNQEFALIFELPAEKDYVEGDEASVQNHKKLYALVNQVRVNTKNMPGFTPCKNHDLSWITCDLSPREKEQVVPSALQRKNGAQHFFDENSQNSSVQKKLNLATGMRIILPEQWSKKVKTEIDPGRGDEGSGLTFVDKENEKQGGVLAYLYYCNRGDSTKDHPYPLIGMEHVLGIYRAGDQEFALIFKLPGDMQYVEGDEKKEKIYKSLFALLGRVQIDTKDMPGFTPCKTKEVDWIAKDD